MEKNEEYEIAEVWIDKEKKSRRDEMRIAETEREGGRGRRDRARGTEREEERERRRECGSPESLPPFNYEER